jgi:hypothetical protein
MVNSQVQNRFDLIRAMNLQCSSLASAIFARLGRIWMAHAHEHAEITKQAAYRIVKRRFHVTRRLQASCMLHVSLHPALRGLACHLQPRALVSEKVGLVMGEARQQKTNGWITSTFHVQAFDAIPVLRICTINIAYKFNVFTYQISV